MGDYLDTVLGQALTKAQRENDGAQLTKEDVTGAAAEAFDEVVKGRRYIDDPSEAPEGVEVQEGERGGTYYEVDDGGSDDSGPSNLGGAGTGVGETDVQPGARGGGQGGSGAEPDANPTSWVEPDSVSADDAGAAVEVQVEHDGEMQTYSGEVMENGSIGLDDGGGVVEPEHAEAVRFEDDGGDAPGDGGEPEGLSDEGESAAQDLGWDKAKAFYSYGGERAADKIVDRAESRAEELGEDPQAFAEEALDAANRRYTSIPDSSKYFGDGSDFGEDEMRDAVGADDFDPEARAAQYQYEDMSPGQIVDQAWRDTREAVMGTIQEESGGDFDYEEANRVATDLADQVREAARERY